jgi:hypothetical protein
VLHAVRHRLRTDWEANQARRKSTAPQRSALPRHATGSSARRDRSRTPSLYDLALAQPSVHHLRHVFFLATAILFWIQPIPSRPFHSKLTSGQRALYLGAAAIAQDLLDLVFVLAYVPVYEFYASLPRGPESMSALADQSIAAGVAPVASMTSSLDRPAPETGLAWTRCGCASRR